jgi:hypothetical protein
MGCSLEEASWRYNYAVLPSFQGAMETFSLSRVGALEGHQRGASSAFSWTGQDTGYMQFTTEPGLPTSFPLLFPFCNSHHGVPGQPLQLPGWA